MKSSRSLSPALRRRSFAPLAWLVAGALGVAASAGIAACSSTTHPAAADNACTALAACCTTLTEPGGASLCASMVSAGNASGTDTTCAATLQSYTQAGLCGASDAAGLPNVDGSLPCELTGTCGSSPDGGAGDSFDDAGFDAHVGDPNPTPTEDAAGPTTEDAAPPPTMDAGPDCGTPPALHPETEPGVYCPFTAAGPIHCPASEQCCEAPSDAGGAASTCEVLGATCPFTGSLNWQCDGPVDCAGSSAGTVCCAGGTVSEDLTCGFDRGAQLQGSHCATSCAAGEVTICAAATDPCPTGTTCTPFKVAGVVLGTCL